MHYSSGAAGCRCLYTKHSSSHHVKGSPSSIPDPASSIYVGLLGRTTHTGCDMLLGNPLLESHQPVLDSKATTFFLTEVIPTPTTIVCNKRLPGVPLISHVQAHPSIKKAVECVRALPSCTSIMSLSLSVYSFSSPPAVPSSLEPRIQSLVNKYQHLMLKDGLPPQLPPSWPEGHHIDLILGANPPNQFPTGSPKSWRMN